MSFDDEPERDIHDECSHEIHKLESRIKKLRDALEYYAERDRYQPGEDWEYNGSDSYRVDTPPSICRDEGDTARDALKEDK